MEELLHPISAQTDVSNNCNDNSRLLHTPRIRCSTSVTTPRATLSIITSSSQAGGSSDPTGDLGPNSTQEAWLQTA